MELSPLLREHLQAATVDEAAWPALMEGMANLLGAEEATLGGGIAGQMPRMVAPRTDPGYVDIYLATYHQQNAVMRAMMRQPVGQVTMTDNLPEFEGFRSSDFYNLWCRPQRFNHAFGFTLATHGGWSGALVINTRSLASSEQARALQHLVPALQRTLENAQLIAQIRGAQRTSLDMLELTGQAGLLLNRHGRAIEMNASAEQMLMSGRLLMRDGRLRSAEAQSDRQLAHLLARSQQAEDAAGGRMTIFGGNGPLALQCAPFPGSLAFPAGQRPAVIVIVTDPDRQLQQRLAELRQSHGLTPAEAELALTLVQAGSRKVAAQLRGVTDATARAQLSSIFDKTGVRRQTDLVRLLLRGS